MESIIFIVLNLIFFSAMFGFVSTKSNSSALYAEAYAKQVALLIDHSRPNMKITLDLSDFYKNIDKGSMAIEPTKKEVVIYGENKKEERKELSRRQFFANYGVEYKIENNALYMEVGLHA